jgi:hypothetical protein
MIHHIALISQTARVSQAQLAPVAASLSKQIVRDFAPIWGVTGTVQAFEKDHDAPGDYYRVFVMDNINEPDAAGFHTDQNHQPYALVQWAPDWTVTASHETLEMLGDPFGNTLVAGTVHGTRVQILRELCDPCESFTYPINGIQMSDFLRPAWYNPTTQQRESCSFLGALSAPQQVAQGGYFSWFDPANGHWWQLTDFGKVQVSDLGTASEMSNQLKPLSDHPKALALRELIDRHTAMRKGAAA